MRAGLQTEFHDVERDFIQRLRARLRIRLRKRYLRCPERVHLLRGLREKLWARSVRSCVVRVLRQWNVHETRGVRVRPRFRRSETREWNRLRAVLRELLERELRCTWRLPMQLGLREGG